MGSSSESNWSMSEVGYMDEASRLSMHFSGLMSVRVGEYGGKENDAMGGGLFAFRSRQAEVVE